MARFSQGFLARIVLPWVITIAALYIAFRGVDLSMVISHVRNADLTWVLVAIALTFLSYLLRAYRWEYFFHAPTMSYIDAVRALFLGFFMNNVLPARAGELVRAHAGSKVSKQSRTLVLATIASERLCDGLTISILLVVFAAGIGDPAISANLMYVAGAFALAACAIIVLLIFRNKVFKLVEAVGQKCKGKAAAYTLERLKIFIGGLEPLLMPSKLPFVIILSLVIWSVELLVYQSVSHALSGSLSMALAVLFMVSVNFSSLIPAAPGGIGVIEAVGKAVLVSVGIDPELALSMVLLQHMIQYLVVGIPGAMILLTWRRRMQDINSVEAAS